MPSTTSCRSRVRLDRVPGIVVTPYSLTAFVCEVGPQGYQQDIGRLLCGQSIAAGDGTGGHSVGQGLITPVSITPAPAGAPPAASH
ncbi:hypothetical protein Shyhy02_39020 [Streptomyces hygroscopicus subsp. hygroscopicus]|nr:hypothetical protein Shyhy02_39020 [Streptomyces hygroscopicus subsp. hygroscopicus]